ncbi:MAG: IS1595 family transposase [Gemmatimonadota bacterium]|nr:IS1595 family transposase [Gemmatimonadota bacterium]
MANRKGKQRKAGSPRDEVLAALPKACRDERAAVEFMEAQRWDESPNCPRCGDTEVSQMKAKDGTRNARFLWRCRGCKQQYTVRVGTIMEDSAIPLRHWCYAFWAACASKKGVSAKQIERMTGLSYKSDLFLMHRIRFAMRETPRAKLGGTVEFDETYVGGKPRKQAGQSRGWNGHAGMGPKPDFVDRKTPVVAGVERGGRVRARVTTDVTARTLRAHVLDMVDSTARIMTDEAMGYRRLRDHFASHETVNHSENEFARGDVTTNTIEGFFSLLKRGVYGTFHNVSRKHLHRYLSEFEFRYNARKLSDGERTALAIRSADHKRLTHAQQVAG